MKKTLVAGMIWLIFEFICAGQTNLIVTDSVQYFRILEARFILGDSITNVNPDFVTNPSGVMISFERDSSILISLDNGGIDKVLLLGYAKRINSPNLLEESSPTESFLWSCKGHNDTDFSKALVSVEQIKDSLTDFGEEQYTIAIIFGDDSYYLFRSKRIIIQNH